MSNTEDRERVMRILNAHARLDDAQIAERLGMQAEEVAAIIQDLEDSGVILGYRALINQEKLSSGGVRAIIEVEVQPERDMGFDRVAKAVGRFEEVRDVYLVSGRYDLRLEVEGESLQQVAFFVASKLASISGVKATATYFLLKKYKQAGFILDKDEEYERLKITP